MQKRITHFDIHKTSFTAAGIMGAITIPFVLLMMLGSLFSGNIGGMFMALIGPALYFIFGYIMTALWCWIYNIATNKFLPGVTMTLEDVAQDKPKADADAVT